MVPKESVPLGEQHFNVSVLRVRSLESMASAGPVTWNGSRKFLIYRPPSAKKIKFVLLTMLDEMLAKRHIQHSYTEYVCSGIFIHIGWEKYSLIRYKPQLFTLLCNFPILNQYNENRLVELCSTSLILPTPPCKEV